MLAAVKCMTATNKDLLNFVLDVLVGRHMNTQLLELLISAYMDQKLGEFIP